jgi:hypothetical protein
MRQIRIERKPRRDRDDRTPPLPLDPRDPDVVRAKRLAEAAAGRKSRG